MISFLPLELKLLSCSVLHDTAITNLGADALEGMMELVENTAIASVEPTADLPENEAWPLSLDNEDSISEERWRPYSTLPIKLCVAVPLQEISLLHLAKMKPGMFLSSSWAAVDDVPLSTSDVFLANVCFEPSGANLGVRITGFAPRTAPVSPRRAAAENIASCAMAVALAGTKTSRPASRELAWPSPAIHKLDAGADRCCRRNVR